MDEQVVVRFSQISNDLNSLYNEGLIATQQGHF